MLGGGSGETSRYESPPRPLVEQPQRNVYRRHGCSQGTLIEVEITGLEAKVGESGHREALGGD